MADLERIYTVPLRSAYDSVRGKRSRKAVKLLRGFISRHMKAEIGDVSLSEKVNGLIWKRGIQKPPRKIKVRAVKAGERVSVLLVDEKVGEAKVEKPPEKKTGAKADASKKEGAKEVKGGKAAGTEAGGARAEPKETKGAAEVKKAAGEGAKAGGEEEGAASEAKTQDAKPGSPQAEKGAGKPEGNKDEGAPKKE